MIRRQIKPLKITPPTPPTPPLERTSDLGREAKITKIENGQPKEYTVLYDEIKYGEQLGRGQFGTVHKTHHLPSGLTFAVKQISDKCMDSSSNERNTENMDLAVLLKLGEGCPYLIKFYGAIHAESYIWLLTEVMDTSIDRFYVKVFALEIQMPEAFVSKLAHAVLSALEFMRNQKLMHRDVKPSNVLINATGEIKVCDFGISGFTKNSVCKTINGSEKYIAPEKIKPDGRGYTSKSDVWSLGISLIEIATGQHPFKNESFMGLARKIPDEPSPRLDASKFSSEFCEFVDGCLIKNPQERASCTALLESSFIQKYIADPIDTPFISKVIDKLKTDPDKKE